MENVKFAGFDCTVEFATYSNGRTAIQLRDANDGQPIATATVNLPDEPMAEDEVAIKNYSENSGMLDILIDTGVIASPHREIPRGFVTIPVCALLVNPNQS